MNIVITGGSSGVGEALSLRLAGKQHQVFALARRADRLEQLAAQGEGRITPMAVDVTQVDQIEAAYATIYKQHGPIDVLINNAAVYTKGPFADSDIQDISRLVETNLIGLMACTRLVVPPMIERKSGRIINIASVAGTRGIPGEAIYCASKHGVVGFGDALAQELVEHGVLLTTLCPGGINTPLWNADTNPYGGPEVEKTMNPSELCDLIEFLLDQPNNTLYKKLIFFPVQEWH